MATGQIKAGKFASMVTFTSSQTSVNRSSTTWRMPSSLIHPYNRYRLLRRPKPEILQQRYSFSSRKIEMSLSISVQRLQQDLRVSQEVEEETLPKEVLSKSNFRLGQQLRETSTVSYQSTAPGLTMGIRRAIFSASTYIP